LNESNVHEESERVIPVSSKGTDDIQTRLEDFSPKEKAAHSTVTVSSVKADLKMTIAQFFKNGAVLVVDDSESKSDQEAPDIDSYGGELPSTLFLEDLETYKIHL
jgi:hypothetical protein